MLEYEDALAQILAMIPRSRGESVPLSEAHERVLNERVIAPMDLPVFDNSAMDGYAVRAADVTSRSAELRAQFIQLRAGATEVRH